MDDFYFYSQELPLDVYPSNEESNNPEEAYKAGCMLSVLMAFVGLLAIGIMFCIWSLSNE